MGGLLICVRFRRERYGKNRPRGAALTQVKPTKIDPE